MGQGDVRVYGPRGTDLERENKELMRENHLLRSQLARIQSCADKMTEYIQSIRRGY